MHDIERGFDLKMADGRMKRESISGKIWINDNNSFSFFNHLLHIRWRSFLAFVLILSSFEINYVSARKLGGWHVPSTRGDIPVSREGLGLAFFRGRLYIFAGKTGSDGIGSLLIYLSPPINTKRF